MSKWEQLKKALSKQLLVVSLADIRFLYIMLCYLQILLVL